jgi:hypothetical protein
MTAIASLTASGTAPSPFELAPWPGVASARSGGTGTTFSPGSAGASKLTETPFDVAAVFNLKGSQTGSEHFAPGDNDDVKTRRDLVMTENLSNQAFRSVSFDRTPKALGGGDPQPADRQLVRQDEHRGQTAVNPGTSLVNLLKLGAAADVFLSSEASHGQSNRPACRTRSPLGPARSVPRPGHTPRYARSSRRGFAARGVVTEATSRDRADETDDPLYSLLTVRRLRPLARRRLRTRRPFFVLMRTRNPCVRLRCRLLGWNVRFPFIRCNSLRSENERTMLANAFGRCQCGVVCVRVCILQDFSADPAEILRRTPAETGICVWSLPKVFHTCGKNCGNSYRSIVQLGFRACFFASPGRAKARNTVKPGLPMR